MTITQFTVVAYLATNNDDTIKEIHDLDGDMVNFITNLMKEEYCLLDEEGRVKVDIVQKNETNVFDVTLDGNIVCENFYVAVDADGNEPYTYKNESYLVCVDKYEDYRKYQRIKEHITRYS